MVTMNGKLSTRSTPFPAPSEVEAAHRSPMRALSNKIRLMNWWRTPVLTHD
jgi:hypothetical protein